jgi:hypothetical protein
MPWNPHGYWLIRFVYRSCRDLHSAHSVSGIQVISYDLYAIFTTIKLTNVQVNRGIVFYASFPILRVT